MFYGLPSLCVVVLEVGDFCQLEKIKGTYWFPTNGAKESEFIFH